MSRLTLSLSDEVIESIKIAALKEKLSVSEYLEALHSAKQGGKDLEKKDIPAREVQDNNKATVRYCEISLLNNLVNCSKAGIHIWHAPGGVQIIGDRPTRNLSLCDKHFKEVAGEQA